MITAVRRDVLQAHPRGRLEASFIGMFATRSPDRPNRVGPHRVSVLEVAGRRLRVVPMEAIDATPVGDINAVLAQFDDRGLPGVGKQLFAIFLSG